MSFTYFFPYFFFSVTGTLNDFPEFDKFVKRDLPIAIEIYRVEELIRRYFAKPHLRPMPLSLLTVNGLIAVLVKDLEDTRH